MIGRTLRDLIEVLVDVDVEVEGASDEVVRVNDENGEIIGYVTGIDVQNGVPWLSFQKAVDLDGIHSQGFVS